MAGKKKKQVYLYIDGVTSRDLLIGFLDESGQVINKRLIKNGSRTEKLLASLVKFINGRAYKISGLIVVQGSGSFSQSRLVCTVANALAYAQNIKITSVSLLSITETGDQLPHLRWQKMLQPVYHGPGVG